MPPSLRAFLDGLIDYAGLFPPAALALDPALRTYARHRAGPDARALGRFVLPAAQLPALDAFAGLFAERPPLRLSVLTRPADEPADLAADVAAARAAESRHGGHVVADAFEAKVSVEAARDGRRLEDTLAAFDEAADRPGRAPDRLWVEVPLDGDGWEDALDAAARAVGAHDDRTGRLGAGLKFRCGGVTPEAFPSVEALARALAAARDADVPFKATAGLHHPIRHFSDDVGATMHGFVNVFGAAVLAHARRLDAAAIGRVLEEERPERFVFDGDGFAWDGFGATAEEVAEARAAFGTSYGSCSFDEPLADLRALGWL